MWNNTKKSIVKIIGVSEKRKNRTRAKNIC